MVVQSGWVNPFNGGTIERLRFTAQEAAKEELQPDTFLRVNVGNLFIHFTDRNFHAQFLADFPDQALLEGLAGFALAPGEFPTPAQMGLRMPLGDQ